jgi:hypothetical protein
MQNFHLTRIAVKLSLIVSLAFQPVVACAVSASFASGCCSTSAFTCEGCGCCEVAYADDRCCCCSGPTGQAMEETAAAGCCSGSDEAFVDSQRSISGSDQVPAKASVTAAVITAEFGVRSICLCEQEPQPLSDSTPRRPVSENRDNLSVGSADLDEGTCDKGNLLAATQYSADISVPEHFSQVVLGIWRL